MFGLLLCGLLINSSNDDPNDDCNTDNHVAKYQYGNTTTDACNSDDKNRTDNGDKRQDYKKQHIDFSSLNL